MVIDDHPAPTGLDMSTPNVARVWDYQLGGKDNFGADREAAEALNDACRRVGAPDGRVVARENRDFIDRAVRYLAGPAGIRQFIDVGAGLPTQGNVHQIAQQVNPDAVVVYVDYDPLVVVHGRALLADNENPTRIVTLLRDALAPGSYLAITHFTGDARPDLAAKIAEEFARLRITTPLISRTHPQILAFFDDFDLVKPGLVFPTLWRPDPPPAEPDPGAQWMYAGVGRKPSPT